MSIVITPIPRLIDLAAPAFTLGTANAAGSAETAIASDSTLLVFDTTLPAATGTAATGSATTAPRRDHVHAGTSLAAPALTLGTANGAGSASSALATDSTILAFDTTLPDAITFGQSGSVGSATVAPRRDHVHAMEAESVLTSTTLVGARTASAGAGTQSITGAGFDPTAAIIFAADKGSAYASWGIVDDANDADNLRHGGSTPAYDQVGGRPGIEVTDGSNDMQGVVTLITDGVQVLWSKNGSGLDCDFCIICFR
jgi:hypothetical protein